MKFEKDPKKQKEIKKPAKKQVTVKMKIIGEGLTKPS